MDLVSVVITTYKRTTELERAIVSVENQTYGLIELIVVDDNIDAEYINDVSEIISHHTQIIYKKNERNLGGALSRNVGLKMAKGKYIAFLDDDDEYLPNKIEKQVEKFISSKIDNLGIVYCFTKAVGNHGEILDEYKRRVAGPFLYENMVSTIAATSQWLCLKSAVEAVRGFRNVPSKQDTTLLLDLALAGYQIDYVPEILTFYHESGGERISNVNEKNLQGEILLRNNMREHYNKLNKDQIHVVEYNIARKIYFMQLLLHKYRDSDRSILDLVKNNQIGYRIIPLIIKHPLRRIVKKKLN